MTPLFVSERDVASLIDMRAAIGAVEHGLRAEAAGGAEMAPKVVIGYDGGTRALHTLSAVAPGLGLAGVKTFVQTGAEAAPMLLVFASDSGKHLATIEASDLSDLRTGALAGVATKHLAAADADTAAIIGSGRQAATQMAALAGVRKLKSVRVWSPNRERRAAFAEAIRARHGVEAIAASSAADAVHGASIVTLAARVSAPIINADMLSRGGHLNSIGVTVAGRSEVSQDIFPRCTIVCADAVASVRTLSDEFRAYYGARGSWDDVVSLADIVAHGSGRPAGADLTLYKGMGTGVADLAVAAEILWRLHLGGAAVTLPDALVRSRGP
jgi:ornithine cyclodeaminase